MGRIDQHILQARKQAAAGNLAGAVKSTTHAMVGNPRDENLRLFRARLFHALGRHHEAMSDLAALKKSPGTLQLALFHADVAEAAGECAVAVDALSYAIPKSETPAPLRARRAVMLQSLGDFKGATRDLQEAISLTPADGELYRLLSGLHRFSDGDPLLDQMQHLRQTMPEGSFPAAHMDFAISKALDDIGDVIASFEVLLRANAAMRAMTPYDPEARTQQLERYKQTLGDLPAAPITTAQRAAPIFVTGLPRSGTTLVEQILSTHPDVTGGGEMALFGPLMRKIIGDPAGSAELTASAKQMSKLGHAYCTSVSAKHPKSVRVTDKSIQTASYMGAVAAALPNAQFIVVRRNPNGNALSLLRQVFQPGVQSFSYNLDDIRHYQQGFDDIVSFWQERLADRVHVVDFDQLTETPEPNTRALLDKAGLTWDAACLHPEKNTRSVQTLSAVAVRKPVSSTAAHKWQRYAAQLAS